MSDTQDKQIKIKISTDDSSVHKFKGMIASMTSSVEKLASTLDRVTRSLEGFNKAQNKTRGGAGVGPITTPGGKSGGIAETIIGSGDGSAVRNAAKATEQALSSTGDHIKRFVDKAIQDINRLNSATKGAGQGPSYSGWTSSTGAYGGGGGGMGGGGAGPGYSEFERGISGIEPPGSARHKGGFWTGKRSVFSPTVVQDEEASASKLWGPRGFAGYAEGRGQALGRMLGLPTGGQNMLGNAGKFIGGNVGMLGGAALGAAVLWNSGAEAFEDTRMGRINYSQDIPFMKRRAAAAGLGLFQDNYAAVQSGSVSRTMAFRKAMSNPEVMASINSTKLDMEKIMATSASNPYTASSGWKWAKDRLQSLGADTIDKIQSVFSGEELGGRLDPKAKASLLQIAGEYAKQNIPIDKANKIREAARFEELAQDPRTAELANRIYGGAEGRLNMARMAGRGVGFDKNGDLAYEMWEANLKKRGLSPEHEAAGHQQLLQIGAGYSKAIDPGTISLLGMAGLGNASGIAQIGGILGGSVGAGGLKSGLLAQLQHSIGRGGLDVAVGRDLFSSLGTQMMQQGTWGAGNTAATALGNAASFVGMVDANGHPTIDVSQQQRMMSMYTQGNAALGTFTKGTGAPIYNAMSLQSAISAMGGYSIGTETMRGMDPNELIAIKNGAAIPAYYRDQFSKDEVVKFLDKTKNISLSTFSDQSLVREGPGKDLINAIRSEQSKGGGTASYIRNITKGMSESSRNIVALDVAERLGGLISAQSGGSTSPLAATGSVLLDLQRDGLWTTPLRGKGVGVAGASGLEKKSIDEQRAILIAQGKHFEGAGRKEVEEAYGEMLKQQEQDRMAIKNIGAAGAGGDLDAVSGSLIAAIQNYSSWFKTHGGAGQASGPVKAQAKGNGKKEAAKSAHR